MVNYIDINNMGENFNLILQPIKQPILNLIYNLEYSTVK